MLRNLLFLILCCFTLLHCKKDEANTCPDGLQEAAIVGQDFRRCVCCGGWFVEIGQDTVRTLSLPADFAIDPVPTNLPIEVCISYEEETGPCKDFEELIAVQQITKR